MAGAAGIKKREGRTRVRASKQLLGYPIARDRRTRQDWHPSEPTGKYRLCNLPGDEEERIQFRLPAECDERLRHCPTPFDLGVLLLVLARAQQMKKQRASFDSCKAMLLAMGYEKDGDGYHRLQEALLYWCDLSIRYKGCWYNIRTKESKETKRLPPP